VHQHETIVERSIEREVDQRLRRSDQYWRADREQRERMEHDVRESIRLRQLEDES
jgi:hypothetical protein